MSEDIQLGAEVQDTVSGFRGIVICIADHLTGCKRIGVRANDTENVAHRAEEEFFYEAQLEPTGEVPLADVGEDSITDCEVNIGQTVRDGVTGFEGIASTINYEIYNCPRVSVTPVDDSSPTENGDREWFDVPRLTVVDDGVVEQFTDLEDATTSETGPSGGDRRQKISRPK